MWATCSLRVGWSNPTTGPFWWQGCECMWRSSVSLVRWSLLISGHLNSSSTGCEQKSKRSRASNGPCGVPHIGALAMEMPFPWGMSTRGCPHWYVSHLACLAYMELCAGMARLLLIPKLGHLVLAHVLLPSTAVCRVDLTQGSPVGMFQRHSHTLL